MSKLAQARLATIALMLASLVVATYLLMIYAVPYLEATWKGTPLSIWQRTLLDWSRWAANTGMPLFLLVLLLFLATLAWRVCCKEVELSPS